MSILDRFRLDGKKLFITGGSRGLGREMTLAIAEAGADVVMAGRTEESLQETCQEIRERGKTAEYLVADMSSPDECEATCQQALSDHGTFDILINNIGGRRIDVPVEEQSLEQWQQILNLNVTSTFLCTKMFGKSMLERGEGGRIINIASISGLITNPGIGGRSYETSKGAVLQFTRATASDWAPHGITVNAICPGTFMTAPNQRWAEEKPELMASYQKMIPMQKFGDPEDIGPLAVYLASDASRYMTGATLVLDGGYTLW